MTSEQPVKHPFAGQNTQQTILVVKTFSLNYQILHQIIKIDLCKYEGVGERLVEKTSVVANGWSCNSYRLARDFFTS